MVHKTAVRHCLSTQGLLGTGGALVTNQLFLLVHLPALARLLSNRKRRSERLR